MHTATFPVASKWVVVAATLVVTVPSFAASPDLSFPDPLPNPTGTELAQEAAELPTEAIREQLLMEEILDGHHPSTTFSWKAVSWMALDASGELHDVVLEVSPDYLAVGTDDDFVTAPLGLPQAAVIARALDFWLPTPLVVDRIYEAAEHHYTPRPLPPNLEMRTPDYWLRHRASLEGFEPVPGDELTAGQKKDVVLTARLRSSPGRIAIYGWHRGVGDPIQPLSLFHEIAYADYSHGIRAIAPTMWVDGEERQYVDVLADPVLCALLSDEGPIDAPAMLAKAIRIGASLGVIAGR